MHFSLTKKYKQNKNVLCNAVTTNQHKVSADSSTNGRPRTLTLHDIEVTNKHSVSSFLICVLSVIWNPLTKKTR